MRLLQSLTRGLEALDYLRANTGPVRLTEVAAALGVDKSNAAHVLKTLVAASYAEQDERRRYAATPKATRGQRRQHSLEAIVAVKEAWRPTLNRLVATTGECAHLAVLVGAHVWYIDKVDSALPLKVDHPIGSLAPLHCTALGKAFLAFGRVDPPPELVAFTPQTLTTKHALAEDLTRIRRWGYAVDNEEFTAGIRCVARPIYDESGFMIAAVGVSGPSVRVNPERLVELGGIVLSLSADEPAKETIS
jgi:DNA-binding IclR family transcriptional regulator